MGLTCELHDFRVYQPLLRVPESSPTGNKARLAFGSSSVKCALCSTTTRSCRNLRDIKKCNVSLSDPKARTDIPLPEISQTLSVYIISSSIASKCLGAAGGNVSWARSLRTALAETPRDHTHGWPCICYTAIQVPALMIRSLLHPFRASSATLIRHQSIPGPQAP